MALIRLATNEYCYIEFETVHSDPELVIDEYNKIYKLYHGGFGLGEKEWCEALDRYLKEGKMDSNVYEQMSKEQQNIIQAIKKAYKRINK